MEVRRQWNDIINVLEKDNCQSRVPQQKYILRMKVDTVTQTKTKRFPTQSLKKATSKGWTSGKNDSQQKIWETRSQKEQRQTKKSKYTQQWYL